jgi:hypothetical protein
MSRSLYLAAALGLALFAGCELPVSVHPLSDEDTSTFDERLIGNWEWVRPADEPVGPSEGTARFTYGRMPGKPNIFESVSTELDGDGYAQVHRIPLYPCKLGELHYLSVIMNPDEPKEKQVYLIMLYELRGENELRYYLLNKDVIGPAIEREDIQGIVKKSDPDPNAPPQEQVKPKYREVKLTAETKDLVAFLQRRGKAAFHTTEFITLRRLDPK